MISFGDLVPSFFTCAQITVAVLMFAWSLPRRDKGAGRIAVSVLVFIAWVLLTVCTIPSALNGQNWVMQACIFVIALGLSFCLVFILFDCSVWAALFCASAGYAMQNLASSLGSLAMELFPDFNDLALAEYLRLIVPYVLVYAACYPMLVKRIRRDGLELIRPQLALLVIILVIFAVICYDVAVKSLSAAGVASSMVISCRMAHIMLCVLVLTLEYEVLYNRRLLLEVATVSQVMEGEREQYRLSKETIEAINLKCHDIRHQIRTLANGNEAIDQDFVDDITRSVNVYDSAVHTGYEPLDVILSEKSLVCSKENIQLSCIVDGPSLRFMAASDLYSLVGNALDNAIEAVRALPDDSHRSISVVIKRMSGMVTIHVENYFAGTVEFRDGLPQTTKSDREAHGFGSKSMRVIATRYGGILHARVQGNGYHLNVMLPVPEE